MGSNDHIVEREQTGQDIIIDNLIRFILVEIVSLLLVDIQSSGRYFLGLQPSIKALVWISNPRPVLIIITPSFILAIESSLIR